MAVTVVTVIEKGHGSMWYFAWLLGLPLAAAFAVLNAMWLELRADAELAGEDDPQAGGH